jgi:hypothetical protein
MANVIDASLKTSKAAPMDIYLAWLVRNVLHGRRQQRGISLPRLRSETALAPIENLIDLRFGIGRDPKLSHA